MAWTKSPPSLIALFDDALPADPRVERRKMFGYPCAFVGGQMFSGLFQDEMMVRLSPDDRAEALALSDARVFEPMAGRPMREYVTLPADVLDDVDILRGWVGRGFAYAAGLPPKKPRVPTAKKATSKKAGARRA